MHTTTIRGRAARLTTLAALAMAAITSHASAQQRTGPEPPPLELPAWETGNSFADIPHPKETFGFEPGTDYKLATNAQIVEYFERLDSASDRVRVVEIGRSVLGRPMLLAFISSAENIARLDDSRAIAEALARGRVDEAAAKEMAASGKAVVWIDGGLHATEVAGAQHTPLLAYRVAGEETEEMRRIRDSVVLLLMPVMNPDGLDIVAEWTARSLGTPWEGSSPPVLYHVYAGHDNNRDWYMMTQPETRAVADVLYNQWYPQVVYNQHQSAPWPARIFIPPFSDPVNPRIPPLVVRGVNLMGTAMGERFSEEAKPGAISQTSFDMWWNGGMRTAPYFHNMIGILTETAHASASPRYTAPGSLPAYIGTIPARAPSVFYPDPWAGGWFRLRDAMEYMLTGDMAVLTAAVRRRRELLFDTWRMARASLEAGAAGDPFAYIIPPDQRNPREAAALGELLRRGGVEVERAAGAFRAGGERYPAGSLVVRASQAFRPDVLDLMEKQVYPDLRQYPDGPPDVPYDVSGWTLPLQMDVRVDRVDEPFEAAGLEAVTGVEVAVWPGRVTGKGGWGWALAAHANAAAIAVNRLLGDGARVDVAPAGVLAGDTEMDRGAFVIRGADAVRLQGLASELGVDFVGMSRAPRGELRPLHAPRVGIYKSWRATSDEGWTRWVLERYGFQPDTLHDADIRTADLSGYDAIILPSQRPSDIMHGNPPGTRPAELTGGIGLDGVARLQEYVRAGGRLIAFDEAAELAIQQFGLPLRNTVAGLPPEEFFVPGALVRIELADDPLTYGMPEEAAAFFDRGSAFASTRSGADVEMAATYAEEDLLASGWALGGDRHLGGGGALARVPLGSGDVVVFGFRPQFRGQPRGTFKLIFNALFDAASSAPAE